MAGLDNSQIAEIREKVNKAGLDYIKKSEETGCTYDRYNFNSYINDLVKSELKDYQGSLTKDEYNNASTAVYNNVYGSLNNAYINSMSAHPRNANNISIPNSYNSNTGGTNSGYIKEANSRIDTYARELLAQSALNNETPTKEQFVNQLKVKINEMCKGLSVDEENCVRAYAYYWAENQGVDLYNDSLEKNPRQINGIFPGDTKKERDLAMQKKRSKWKRSLEDIPLSKYHDKYKTFSGTDMVCTVSMPLPTGGFSTQVIGELQTVSYSIHDEKTPVRCLGNMNVKGYVFGPRTIAGSMIFNVFDSHWAKNLMRDYMNSRDYYPHFMADELPALDLTISFVNEYGAKARLAIYGVTFVNEGQVMSINDMYMENTYQFYATDVEYLTAVYDSQKEDDPVDDITALPKIESNIRYLNDVSSKEEEAKDRKKVLEKSTDPSQPLPIDTSEYSGLSYDEYANAVKISAQKTSEELDEKLKRLQISPTECERLKQVNLENYEKRIKSAKEYYTSNGVAYRN